MTHLVYARSQFPLPVCDFRNRASLHAADLCNTNIQRSLFCLKSGKFFKIYGEIWEINWEIWAFYYPPCWLNAYSTMKKSSKEEKALVRCRPKFAQRLRKWITKGNPESTERGLESGIQSVPFKIHDWLELPQMDDGSDRSMGRTRKIRICTPLLFNPTPTRSTRCLNQRQGRQSRGTLIAETGQNLFSIVHSCD